MTEIVEKLRGGDDASREERARRIARLNELMPFPEKAFMLSDGDAAPFLLSEIQIAYANGLYLGVILLSLAFAERQIAAKLYAAGDNSAARMSLEKLLEAALAVHAIDEPIAEAIDYLRGIRNDYAHFRIPLHDRSIAYRAIKQETSREEVLEQDANKGLQLVGQLINSGRLAF